MLEFLDPFSIVAKYVPVAYDPEEVITRRVYFLYNGVFVKANVLLADDFECCPVEAAQSL